MMSMPASAWSRLCMMMTGERRAATSLAMSGSRCRPQTSLAMDGTGIERPGDDGRFHAVDRDGNTEGHDIGQDRLQALQLFIRRNRFRAIGPGGFRADVDDVGALGDHAPGLRQRALRRDELSAVRKRIRRDIQDAHHGRIRPGQQCRPCPMIGRGGRRGGSGRGRDHAVALRGPRMGSQDASRVRARGAAGCPGRGPES